MYIIADILFLCLFSHKVIYHWHSIICLSLLCLALLIAIIVGINLYRKRHFRYKHEIFQKDQELTLVKENLHKEQETHHQVSEAQKKIILSLREKIKSLIDHHEKVSSTFLHTNLLSIPEYDKFIVYFHISIVR